MSLVFHSTYSLEVAKWVSESWVTGRLLSLIEESPNGHRFYARIPLHVLCSLLTVSHLIISPSFALIKFICKYTWMTSKQHWQYWSLPMCNLKEVCLLISQFHGFGSTCTVGHSLSTNRFIHHNCLWLRCMRESAATPHREVGNDWTWFTERIAHTQPMCTQSSHGIIHQYEKGLLMGELSLKSQQNTALLLCIPTCKTWSSSTVESITFNPNSCTAALLRPGNSFTEWGKEHRQAKAGAARCGFVFFFFLSPFLRGVQMK